MDFTGERLVPGKVDLELEVEHINRYEFASQLTQGKRVLDAACGTGYGADILSKYAQEVHAIDISDDAIKYAQDNYKKENLNFKVADIENLPFKDNYFDIVVSFETIEHVNKEKQKNFLSEIKRVLKDDGILIMSTPNREIYDEKGINNFHVSEFSVKEFKDFLGNKFKKIEMFNQKFEVGNAITLADKSKVISKSNMKLENADYVIALCTDEKLPIVDGRIDLYKDDKYREVIKWAISNHETNAELNKFIDKFSSEKTRLQQENAELDMENDKLEKELTQAVIEYKNVKNELERVYNSRGHKMLEKLYKIEEFILPPGSRRRFILKMMLKTIRHPLKYIKKLSFVNIKNLISLIKQGNIYSVGEKIGLLEDEKCNFIFEEVNLNQTEFEKLKVPKCDEPLVSIIIPVYNQFHYTYNCIKSIIRHTKGIQYEIIIADDVSTDKTKEIENIIENIKVIHNEKNLGFLLNCNNAAKLATGKYIHFLNNDTSVQRNWLSTLINLIESDDTIGMVGSKLVYPTGVLQEAGGIFWNDASAWNYGRNKSPMAAEYNYVKDVDYISGASIMIYKSLWNEIGGFDERYIPAYYEDSDLAFEVRKHGYRVVYQPESVVVHFEGMSNGTDTSTGVKAYQIENKDKFYEKWKDVLQKDYFKNGENVFLARDRSKDKKCILFIDHYVPTFDKDAGSRATYQHLKMMVDLGYNIKFIGDNFLKYEKYTKALEDMGIEVLYGRKYAMGWKAWVKENAKYIDTVVLNRPHIAKKYIDFIKANTDSKIVYYICDLHFLREGREYEITKDPKLKASSEYWEKIEMDLIKKSDKAVTFSLDEKGIIEKSFENKAVITPIFIFDKFDNTKVDLSGKKDIMFVGGFNHRPNEDGVLWFIDKVWPMVSKELPDCNFIIAGSNPTEKIKNLASDRIKVTGFVSDEQLEEYYNSCRVCVVPLRYGAGVKGKTIEAIYHKIPIVSTPIGVEGLMDIESCIKPTIDPTEFSNKIIEYYKNDELVQKDVSEYHKYLNKYFSSEYTKKIFKDIF